MATGSVSNRSDYASQKKNGPLTEHRALKKQAFPSVPETYNFVSYLIVDWSLSTLCRALKGGALIRAVARVLNSGRNRHVMS